MIESKPRADILITGAAEVLTCVPSAGEPAGRMRGASVAIAGDRIIAVGPHAEITAQFDTTAAKIIDASGKVVAPGFVDCHTHLVFGGSRADEYAARMTMTAAEMKKLGIPTGILATVDMTRAASADELTASAADRLGRMLSHGTTTVEAKSGYGLTLADEIKILEVNRRLAASSTPREPISRADSGRPRLGRPTPPIDIVSTFLGAHAVPPELAQRDYVDLVINEMIPQVAERGLAKYCDVYCDTGYFSAAESRRILEAGRSAGLHPKIHADQYSDISGSAVAAELAAVSADHLNYTPRASMRKLAEAGVIGVLMPALDFAVAHPRPFDARAMIAEGMTIALATDLCPGCWVESMQLVMQLACRLHRLSPAEALCAATAGAAKALGLDHDRGTLEPGKLADIQVWNVPSLEHVIYRIGSNAVQTVIKRGRVAA